MASIASGDRRDGVRCRHAIGWGASTLRLQETRRDGGSRTIAKGDAGRRGLREIVEAGDAGDQGGDFGGERGLGGVGEVRCVVDAETVELDCECLLRLTRSAGDGEAGTGGRYARNGKPLRLEVVCHRGKLRVGGAELLGELLRGEPVMEGGRGGVSLSREELVEGGGLGGGGLKTDGEGEGFGDGELAGIDSGVRGDGMESARGDGDPLGVRSRRGEREEAEQSALQRGAPGVEGVGGGPRGSHVPSMVTKD